MRACLMTSLGAIACTGAAVIGLAQQTAGTAVLTGTVVTDSPSPQPVRHATVRLAGPAGTSARLVGTGDEGTFEFVALPAARYSVSASKIGSVTTFYGSKRPGRGPGVPVALLDGERASIVLKLLPGAVITGTIADHHGRPAAGVPVLAVDTRADAAAPARALTDDRGVYRIYGLAPGDYVVSAIPRPGTTSASVGVSAALAVTDAQARWAQSPSGAAPAGWAANGVRAHLLSRCHQRARGDSRGRGRRRGARQRRLRAADRADGDHCRDDDRSHRSAADGCDGHAVPAQDRSTGRERRRVHVGRDHAAARDRGRAEVFDRGGRARRVHARRAIRIGHAIDRRRALCRAAAVEPDGRHRHRRGSDRSRAQAPAGGQDYGLDRVRADRAHAAGGPGRAQYHVGRARIAGRRARGTPSDRHEARVVSIPQRDAGRLRAHGDAAGRRLDAQVRDGERTGPRGRTARPEDWRGSLGRDD